MVILFFELLASPRWLWRNTCLLLLAWFLFAVQTQVSSEDRDLLTMFDDLHDELSTKTTTTPCEVTDSGGRATGEETNDETPNNAGGASSNVHVPPEGVSTVSYSTPYYPPPYQNVNQSASSYNHYNQHQRPYQHRYGGGYRQRNYGYQQNYDYRPPHYRRPHSNDDKNGTDTRHQPWQRYPQQRAYHPYTDHPGNPPPNDNGNYTPTFSSDYYHHEYPMPPNQPYYDHPYQQSYVAPPFDEQNYAYPPAEQYYDYAHPPAAAAPPVDPHYGYPVDYPQYGEQQPQYYHQPSYGPHEEVPLSAATEETSDTTVQAKGGRRRDRSKKTKTTESTTLVTPAHVPPPNWDPNAPVYYAPHVQGNWYPQNYPIYPYNPNWYPAAQHYTYQQYQSPPPQQQQQNIDWQVLHLNFEDEVSANWLQSVDPQSAKTTKKSTSKRETTEKNYNTFAPEELRDRTRTVHDDVNHNTYSDKEWKELHGVTDSHSVEQEYVEYDTRELEESDSNETRDYNTREPAVSTKSTLEINHNTYGPEDLRWAHTATQDRNYNTHGNRPYIHTDAHESNEHYTEHPSPLNESHAPSYHAPQARHSKYFASAKPPVFEVPTLPYSAYREKNRQHQQGQLSVSLDNMMLPNMSANEMDDGKTKMSQSFLNRWLFGRHGTTEPRATFDHSLFFSSPATKDHWLLSDHKLEQNKTSTRSTTTTAFDGEYKSIPWLPPLYTRYGVVGSYATTTRPTPGTPSSHVDNNQTRPHHTRSSSSTNGTPGTPSSHVEGDRTRPHYTRSSSSTNGTDATTTRPTPGTPPSSVDGGRTRPHPHNHHHNHRSNHHSTKVEHTSPMSTYKPRAFSLSHTVKHHHHHHKHHHHHHHPQHASKHHRRRYARDVSSSSDSESYPSENQPSPLDVSDAKEYCAWADQQRFLQSMERREKEDRQNQKMSRRPLFSDVFEVRSQNPEYSQTPYWTGSTSYVWLPGGRKRKVIDLPDESYGLLIEDEEEWWQAQRREAKIMRANKFMGLNAEGARKSRLDAQATTKKSKGGGFMGFVKNVFRKITGRKKPDETEDHSKHQDDGDRTGQNKDDELTESDGGDRRNWGRHDRRSNRWRGGGGQYQHRNYNNPNQRNYPDIGYRKYNQHNNRGPGPNYNQEQQQGQNPNDGNQQQQDNRRFHYRPPHYNYNQPENSDNRQNYRQDQNNQGAAAEGKPQNNENSYTRSIDQTPQ